MPDTPNFNMQNNFPVSDVINAAQRKAMLDNQTTMAQSEMINNSLNKIGEIGQSLHQQKQRIAQSLALGKQTGIPDDLAKTMTPEQILELDRNARWANRSLATSIDPSVLSKFANVIQPNGTLPISSNAPANGTSQPNGAVLASNVTATPIPDTAPNGALPADSAPVPISAPPLKPKPMNTATFNAALKLAALARSNTPEAVMTQDQALKSGTVPKGTRIINPNANSDAKEQDKLEQQARQGLQSIRGDTSIKNVEAQRDAAITAYNRLKQIEFSGKAPNPVDYVDILGQVYKARTGTAPTDVVLRDARQQTTEGKFGQVYTFFTGNQAPATSKDIASSLKDMVAHMGLQADELHDGYMQVHGPEIFPTGLASDRADKLAKVARGKSFTEATGAKPEDYDPHVQAIQWAQAHPDDPRSAPIMQKAMEAKGGKQIGL